MQRSALALVVSVLSYVLLVSAQATPSELQGIADAQALMRALESKLDTAGVANARSIYDALEALKGQFLPPPPPPEDCGPDGTGNGKDDDLDGQIDEGCLPKPPPPPPLPPSAGPHDYYDRLCARPDKGVCFSLRDPVQLETYRTYRGTRPAAVTYDPARDTDPRKQDAAKMVIPGTSLASQLRFPLGNHHPKNLLITYDLWYGAEFAFSNTGMPRQKGMLQVASPKDDFWLSLHGAYNLATVQPQNFPQNATHGPFLVTPYLHSAPGSSQFYRCGTVRSSKTVPHTVPYNVTTTQRRNYGEETLMPRDTSVNPGGAEFGVKAETWTRYWLFFERYPTCDLAITSGTQYAYRLSVWLADVNRDPVRLYNDLVVYPSPLSPGGFVEVWYEFNASASAYMLERIADGRGPLVGYLRNLATLKGTPKADVLTLLQRPQ